MKPVFVIARTELRSLFYSPIAWVLLVVFLAQSGTTLVDRLLSAAYVQAFGREDPLTEYIFLGHLGVLGEIRKSLFLYIPLLTMGLLSREYQSGSIKLLLSAPVRVADVVLGKYLAVAGYCCVLCLLLVGMMIASALSVESFDTAAALTGILGILLFSWVYCAVGLFMSALTSYQVVAGISTLAMLTFLQYIGRVGQTIPIINDITHWASLQGRVYDFQVGLISSSNMAYFVTLIVLFLSLTSVRLAAFRLIEKPSRRVGRYLVCVGLALLVGYATSVPSAIGYVDVTRNQANTLAPESQEIVSEITGDWNITTVSNILGEGSIYVQPSHQNWVYDRFRRYTRFNPHLSVDFLYYAADPHEELKKLYPSSSDQEITELVADETGYSVDSLLDAVEIRKLFDVGKEGDRATQFLEWQERRVVMRLFRDVGVFPSEPEVSAAMKQLLVGPVRVGYLVGNGERPFVGKGDDAYQKITTEGPFRAALVNHGFVFEEVEANSVDPDYIDLLAIAGPQEPYDPDELSRIQSYIDDGGDLLVALEPESVRSLSEITDRLGLAILVNERFAIEPDYSENTVFGSLSIEAGGVGFKPLVPEFAQISSYDSDIFLSEPLGLDVVDDRSFSTANLVTARTAAGRSRLPSTTEAHGVPVAIGLQRQINGRNQRIVVLGDADIMSNRETYRSYTDAGTANVPFARDVFHWLSGDSYPLRLTAEKSRDRTLLVDRRRIRLFRSALYYGALPLLLILGTLVLYSRRFRR